MNKNLNFLMNDANYNEFDEELHGESLPRVAPGGKPPALKHVKDMTKAEADARLKELTDPKFKFAIHTIAKHASKMDDAEYKKELARLMDCFSV